MYGYNSVEEFLVKNRYNPETTMLNVNDLYYIYQLLTGMDTIDFVVSNMYNPGYREQSNAWQFTFFDDIYLVCGECRYDNSISVLRLLDNKIKHGTWCSQCVSIKQAKIRQKMMNSPENIAKENIIYRNNSALAKSFKMVQVKGPNGELTNDVTCVRRSEEELNNMDLNEYTKKALARGDFREVDNSDPELEQLLAMSRHIDPNSITRY